MLVLLSFVLVLVATVLLVLGLLVSGDGLTLIYVSIGMSAVAAALLIVAVRGSKPSYDGATGPSPLEPEPEPDRELVGAGARHSSPEASASTATLPVTPPVAPRPPVEPPLDPAPAAAVPMAPPPVEQAGREWLASDAEWGTADDDWGDDGTLDFPIADYDDLTVDEVLPLLPQLYSDELDVVEAREREGLSRREVIDTLARLRITGTEADRELGDEVEDEEAAEADPGLWQEPEEDVSSPDDDGGPLPGYDDMAVSEIVASLARLDDAGLDAVRAHEASTKNRRTVLAAIDRRLGATAPAPVAAVPPAKKAPAKKAAPKKAAAKKAPAKKAAPKKAAPPKEV